MTPVPANRDHPLNTAKYLMRIRYAPESQPDYDVLCQLQKAHLLSIPFENLDIHYGTPITLDIHRIFKKIIPGNRGGFCYELNGLFYHLLISLGFKAKIISARVHDEEKGFGPEFDHLAILVNLDGTEYLSDVGFGEFAFFPLNINSREIQYDQRGKFIIDHYDEDYLRVSKFQNGNTIPSYIFKTAEQPFPAFSTMCNYHQTNENSHFTRKRLISMATEQGRITISGNTLKIVTSDSVSEAPITDEKQFETALWQYFNIQLDRG